MIEHSAIAEFEAWAEAPTTPEPEVQDSRVVYRLNEPGVGCQIFSGGFRHGDPLECGNTPASPSLITVPNYRPDERSETRLRICQRCFDNCTRPIRYLEAR